jgi:hypothetical protein
MSDIIEKVKEKAKESFSTPTSQSSSINPNTTFMSSSVTYVPNPEKNNSDIEIEKVDSPLTEHIVSEQKIFSTNIMQENSSIKITNTTSFDSEVTKNQQIDNRQHYNYKENDEFSNPFIVGLKLWQNHYTMWMNFYSETLNNAERMTRNYLNTY